MRRTIALPARYMWLSLSTSTQRTATCSIGRTSTMNRDPEREVPALARRSLCAMAFRCNANTLSSVEKVRVYAIWTTRNGP